MATERLSMRKTREILRLKELKRSHREISRVLSVGGATVSETAARARAAGLDWAAVAAMTDVELDARLYPRPTTDVERPLPDPVSPPASVGTRTTGVTGTQGPTRWSADGSSPQPCRGGASTNSASHREAGPKWKRAARSAQAESSG